MGRFWVFFLSHTARGFQLCFISTSTCGSSTVEQWNKLGSWPGALGFAPVGASCGVGAAAWVTGVLAALGTQGSWWLRQKEIQCSRRVWQPVLADMLQYSCLENPFPDIEAWKTARSLQGCKEPDMTEASLHTQTQDFL